MLDISTGKEEIKPFPIYSITQDGRTAVSPNFDRLHRVWPAYGYAGGDTESFLETVTEDDGLFLLDLETGDKRLLLSIAAAADRYGY